MKMHPLAQLERMVQCVQQHHIPVIFDEIFTGFGRTGTLFASNQLNVIPDIVCLGKGLTGGMTPLSATIAHQKIYKAFLSDNSEHAFMHGPTFTGHALGCAVALASLKLFQETNRLEQAKKIEQILNAHLLPLQNHKNVKNARVKGAVGVIQAHDNFSPQTLAALKQHFINEGVWLRPFGDILYLTPALNIPPAALMHILKTVESALSVMSQN